MAEKDTVQVGVLAPSDSAVAEIRSVVKSTELGSVVCDTSQYPTDEDSGSLSLFESKNPQIILIEVDEMAQTLATIRAIHRRLPDTWILAVAEVNDPQIIIECVRAGAREFLPKPISSEGLLAAFQRYLGEHARTRVDTKGQVYWLTAAKGGSGTTSVAINLAKSISELEGTRVALLDLNRPVGDAATYLNIRPEFTAANALAAGERLDPVLLESYLNTTQGISVLSGSSDFQPKQALEAPAVRRLLQVSSRAYSHTLVDLPSFLPNDLLLSLARQSDRILVVLTPELPALWRTHRLLQFLEQGDFEQKLCLILNRFDKKSEISKTEIEKTLEQRISWTLPNDYQSAIQAINSGQPLVSLNHTPLASSFEDLAQDLTGLMPPAKRKRGLLGNLFT